MSRYYLSCGHYNVYYEDDQVWLGDLKDCLECQGWPLRKVVSISEGEQGTKDICGLTKNDLIVLDATITTSLPGIKQELRKAEHIQRDHPSKEQEAVVDQMQRILKSTQKIKSLIEQLLPGIYSDIK